MSELAVWAWRGKRHTNFGDELGPAILERLGHTVRRVPTITEADVIACGSILDRVDANRSLIVWGSGLMHDRMRDLGRLDIRAVRGRITARAFDVDVPLGDPGLLVPDLWGRTPTQRRIGVVPHYVDDRRFPWADVMIDVTRPVDQVIAEIRTCSTIASSSLHGLIVADAYGIPTMRLPHPRVLGGDTKWADYLTSRNRPLSQIQSDLLACAP